MKTCADVSMLLGQFLALDLAPQAEAEVRAHLAGCARCRAAVDDAEPATGLALRLAGVRVEEDEEFVAGVLAGVHQHRLERHLGGGWRRWVGVAAALVVVAAGGYLGVRGDSTGTDATVAAVRVGAVADDAPFVEVEGDGVTVYQLTSASQDAVQVALIIDPRLEL